MKGAIKDAMGSQLHIRDYQSFISTDMHTDEDTGYQLLVLRPEIDE